jgi:hypothetical protein
MLPDSAIGLAARNGSESARPSGVGGSHDNASSLLLLLEARGLCQLPCRSVHAELRPLQPLHEYKWRAKDMQRLRERRSTVLLGVGVLRRREFLYGSRGWTQGVPGLPRLGLGVIFGLGVLLESLRRSRGRARDVLGPDLAERRTALLVGRRVLLPLGKDLRGTDERHRGRSRPAGRPGSRACGPRSAALPPARRATGPPAGPGRARGASSGRTPGAPGTASAAAGSCARARGAGPEACAGRYSAPFSCIFARFLLCAVHASEEGPAFGALPIVAVNIPSCYSCSQRRCCCGPSRQPWWGQRGRSRRPFSPFLV